METPKQSLKLYLMQQAEYTKGQVDSMDSYELIDAWLKYNGIIGFTDEIIEVVTSAKSEE